MGEQFESLAPEVRGHIQSLVSTAGMTGSDDALERLSAAWLEKQSSFFEQTKQREMEELESFEIEDSRGVLLMTYSGSLISIGPDTDEGRSVDYVSIGLRSDVPESAGDEHALLAADVIKGKPAEFEKGPIAKSSPIYAIAAFNGQRDEEEVRGELEEVTLMLTRDFIDINKTIIED